LGGKNNRFQTTDLDRARDELFSHVHRCGVLKATAEQQEEWMEDTVEYLGERYPDLSREDLGELRTIGVRFCRPVIDYGEESTAGEAEVKGTEAEAVAA
jgi:hypothetical protein